MKTVVIAVSHEAVVMRYVRIFSADCSLLATSLAMPPRQGDFRGKRIPHVIQPCDARSVDPGTAGDQPAQSPRPRHWEVESGRADGEHHDWERHLWPSVSVGGVVGACQPPCPFDRSYCRWRDRRMLLRGGILFHSGWRTLSVYESRLWALCGVASRMDVLVGASDCPGGQREFVRGLFGGVLAMGQ